jgi:hypothetical protein
MNAIKKFASSLDGAINLVLGENTKRSVDMFIDTYTFSITSSRHR